MKSLRCTVLDCSYNKGTNCQNIAFFQNCTLRRLKEIREERERGINK